MDPNVIIAVAAAALTSSLLTAVVTSVLGHQSEVARAREERRQTRLADTYLEAATFAMTLQDFVNRTLPRMEKPGDPKAPPLPTDDEQRVFAARLSIFGSPAMFDAFTGLVRAQVTFVNAVDRRADVLEDAEKGRNVSEEDDQAATFAAINDVRVNQVRPAVAAVLQLAHAELAERRKGGNS
jgi:hypothetical protein